MEEPKFLYKHQDFPALRDTYPHFYYALLSFLKQHRNKLFFLQCFNQELDGSRFAIILEDSEKNHHGVTAIKHGSTYSFEFVTHK